MDTSNLVRNTDQVSCLNDRDECVTTVVVRGPWGNQLRTLMSRVLRACVAETPRVIVVDLSELSDDQGESAMTWQTLTRFAAQRRAPIGLIVCSSPPRVAERLQASSTGAAVTTAETVAAARAAGAGYLQWPHQHRLPLPPDRVAVFLGGRTVHDLCISFGLPALAPTARLIASELISNAVDHARTDLDVALSVRGDVLHLGVYDRHSGLPVVAEAEPWHPDQLRDKHGAGLWLVDAAATAWGALPWHSGKLVWATLAIDGWAIDE
ncbi:ATP-binding protein [Actinoplanes sp. NPDC048967]|uniref:ATP-binding protein n=1 Tax=Actinoplanes sp. NPDC048967 TaxID=3155269 RepID=UPI0033D1AE28